MSAPPRDISDCQLRDVVVIGSGVTGSIVARELALSGLDVLLVERKPFPRRKVCGCCLNARAIHGLKAVGLADIVEGLKPVELNQLSLRAFGRAAELPMPRGWAVSRSALDFALMQAAQSAGVEVWTDATATVGECFADRRLVTIELRNAEFGSNSTEQVAAKVVVAADGLGHPSTHQLAALRPCHQQSEAALHSRLGGGCEVAQVPDHFSGGAIHMLVGRAGYVGLTQVESGCWNIAAAFDRSAAKEVGGLGATAARIAAEATGQSCDFLTGAEWSGTPLLTQAPARVALERLFLAGDAAGYVEPFTGEGMAGAIESALAVSSLACNAANEWRDEWALQWTVQHRRIIRQRAWICRGLARLLRSPGLVRTSIELLRYCPRIAEPVMRSLNAPSSLRAVREPAPIRPQTNASEQFTPRSQTAVQHNERPIRCP